MGDGASPMRMDAYYYSFKPTGCAPVDRILSAVATAGKRYHHTENWANHWNEGDASQESLIQAAADAAAWEWKRVSSDG